MEESRWNTGQRLKEVELGHLGIGTKSVGDQLAHECLAFCQFDIIQVVHFFKVAELILDVWMETSVC